MAEFHAGNVIDVLISDIGMPEEDGYALIRRVRALPMPAGAIPAIALTAFSAAADIERALAAGFDQHLGKPVDSEQLIHALAETKRSAA